MSRRRRRNTKKTKKESTESTPPPNNSLAPFDNTQTQTDINLIFEEAVTSTVAPSTYQQRAIAMDSATSATPALEYEDDIFLDEEDEFASANDETTTTGTESEDVLLEEIHSLATTTEVDNAASILEEREEQPESQATQATTPFEQAKAAMAWSAESMLTQTPEMATVLRLNKVGDTTAVSVTAHNLTYAITWKVTAIQGVEPEVRKHSIAAPAITAATSALREASPLSAGLPKVPGSSGVKCKFGRACNKGAACPYDHTIKAKPCSYVNTAKGCSSGANCEFSHDLEGQKCTRSMMRYMCLNGRGCAFRHGDDWPKPVMKNEVLKKAEPAKQTEPSMETQPQQQNGGSIDATPPVNAPTGPKSKRGSVSDIPTTEVSAEVIEQEKTVPLKIENAPTGPRSEGTQHLTGGQKRAREDNEEVGNATQRPRFTQYNNARGNFRGRGRGRGAGQGFARGGGRGRGDFGINIRGAATRGGN